MLAYQPELGSPWLIVVGRPLYRPWALFAWWYHFDAYAPLVFDKAGILAGASGFAGCSAAIAGSLWRARQRRNVTTYGSARWATTGEITRAGLHGHAGILLGRTGANYLRHGGPEHVLAFAPTRSGMSFLGLYRDPTVAAVTSDCDWRIADLIDGKRPISLYLVVPPSDISRTKPLVRLILNQIGRRLTERLETSAPGVHRHQLLLMLDEFPALGRLDFFETSLAFMAGYGIRAFLIAQSLNQIEKAYGEYNSILDNCHVRVAFATNDERTAKRISDALGTATEQRSMRNYAGHRLAPWLAHVMVSRQETARALLTPGEIMQLPPTDELVLVSGLPPIRATKLRYYEDPNFVARALPAPTLSTGLYADRPPSLASDWRDRTHPVPTPPPAATVDPDAHDEGGLQQQRLPSIEDKPPTKDVGVDPEVQREIEDDDTTIADRRSMDRARGALSPARAYGFEQATSQIDLGL